MAFYLVDYENVNTEGMQGVELYVTELPEFEASYLAAVTLELPPPSP